jgi:hypothetical protein|tara:strand:- start:1460 stop:1927 length:468 start_codon:yes stop_codon:yes gene_type:complete
MSLVAITNFLTIRTATGSIQNRFQNSKQDTPITVDGQPFLFLSFIYQGAARNRSGDNMESSLILANNAIGMNHAREAVDNKYHIDVDTFLMNTDFTTNKLLTRETWLAASLSYDPTTVEVLLSSAIDAVGANAPNKVLTTAMVGHLPITGTIQSR